MPREALTAQERWLRGYDKKRPAPRPTTVTVGGEKIRVPAPPKHLSEHGRKAWRQLFKELYALDLVCETDMQAFEILVGSYDVWRLAQDAIAEHGVLVEDGRGGLRKSPALQVARDAATTFTRLADKFGITPKAAAALGLSEVQDNGGW